MRALTSLFVREMQLAIRIGGGVWMGVLFFLCVIVVVPFGIGPDLNLLSRIGPAILWIGALLASLLGLDRLFQADRDDGSLDLLLMGETPLELVVFVKCLAHWAASGLPLVISAPVFALFLNMDPIATAALTVTLVAGTPALTLIGAIGAALTVSLRRGGLLLAILVLPLTIPVLIFGVSASNAALNLTLPFTTPFAILCALTLISAVVEPYAAATALRFASD
ncbi:heme exporter protein CcmB [Breoghania sp.]|uniref:heme exporter protein CcmB n=1 Tax=Breoghania sp. TaxID=2065378 RepID=UPI002603E796|nr:heme exporter protein CcmB [Breoghania sp.]MDJ0931646.1 heme exporter protein CcmB [Breoghania sp.]